MQHLRNREEMRSKESHPHLVVVPDVRPHSRVGLVDAGVADAEHTRPSQIAVDAMGRADVEAIAEEVQRDRQGAEADGRVAGGRDVRVAVASERDDPGHLQDDLVPGKGRDAFVKRFRRAVERLRARRVIEISVSSWQLRHHHPEVFSPLLGGERVPRSDLRERRGRQE
jgi:hypothetical protein